MRWDRKLAVFSVFALLFILAAAGTLLWFTHRSVTNISDRIAGEAEEGYDRLMKRTARAENIFRVSVNRRGKFESQQKYRGFDPAWLRELSYVPGEYLDEEVSYTHAVTFRLKSYDTEGVYSHRDSPVAYTRYDDSAEFRKSGGLYYVTYVEGNTVYHFIAECPKLTEWIEEVGRD